MPIIIFTCIVFCGFTSVGLLRRFKGFTAEAQTINVIGLTILGLSCLLVAYFDATTGDPSSFRDLGEMVRSTWQHGPGAQFGIGSFIAAVALFFIASMSALAFDLEAAMSGWLVRLRWPKHTSIPAFPIPAKKRRRPMARFARAGLWLLALATIGMTGCTTLVAPDGSRRTVLTPAGTQIVSAAVNVATSTLVGYAYGGTRGAQSTAIGSLSGSAASSLVGALLPQGQGVPVQYMPAPQIPQGEYPQQGYYVQPSARRQYNYQNQQSSSTPTYVGVDYTNMSPGDAEALRYANASQ